MQPATVQRILRHSSIAATTGAYAEVIEAVQRDALGSMSKLFSVGLTISARPKPLSSQLSPSTPIQRRSSGLNCDFEWS